MSSCCQRKKTLSPRASNSRRCSSHCFESRWCYQPFAGCGSLLGGTCCELKSGVCIQYLSKSGWCMMYVCMNMQKTDMVITADRTNSSALQIWTLTSSMLDSAPLNPAGARRGLHLLWGTNGFLVTRGETLHGTTEPVSLELLLASCVTHVSLTPPVTDPDGAECKTSHQSAGCISELTKCYLQLDADEYLVLPVQLEKGQDSSAIGFYSKLFHFR